MAIVFIGGGRITSALLAGLRLADYKEPIAVHDRNAHKLRALKKQFGVAVEPDLRSAVAQASMLIIAVRPSDVAEVLERVREAAFSHRILRKSQRGLIACSLAAGIPMAKLKATLGLPVRWARAMPSPVARTRRGLTAVTFERGFPRSARKRVEGLFAKVGAVLEVPESKFDAFTATYSSSHGYHALFALARAGQRLGLDHRIAFAAAAHALADGIVSWREEDTSLEDLLHEAATPGGIAASVMRTMDLAGYLKAIEKGLRAGVARARKNARLVRTQRKGSSGQAE
jgi:pyrroline-5-carboxylate reductase